MSPKDLMNQMAQIQVRCMAEKIENERNPPSVYPPQQGQNSHRVITIHHQTVILKHFNMLNQNGKN